MRKWLPVVISVAVLTACQQKPDDAELAQCWSADAKQTISKMAKESLVDRIATLIKGHGGKGEQLDQKRISSLLNVSTNDYFAVSVDRSSGSVTCGAQVSMMFSRDSAESLHAENASIQFAVYRAETGHMYSISNTMPLAKLISEADEAR